MGPATDDADIRAFWADARVRGALNPAEAYIGVTASDTLPPPAWSFGTTAQEADALLRLVLEGRKTATASALWEYEAEAAARAEDDDGGQPPRQHAPRGGEHGGDTLVRTRLDLDLPAPGALSILLDGAGVPRALIRTTHVDVVRFGAVGEDHARREGEGSLERWRAEHRRFFAQHAPAGSGVDDDTLVVLERFVVLVPASARRAARRARLL